MIGGFIFLDVPSGTCRLRLHHISAVMARLPDAGTREKQIIVPLT